MSRARDVASLLNTVATDEELTSGLSEKLSYEFASASPTTTASGFLWYDSNSSPAAPKFWDGAAFQALTSGKILQIVRATDSTDRSTTSTSFVDVTGMSVTITPQKTTSAVLVVSTFRATLVEASGERAFAFFALTDSSNNTLSGAEDMSLYMKSGGASSVEIRSALTLIGYVTPATTSAVTYKLRFRQSNADTVEIENASSTGQMFAIEVSA